MKQPKLEHGTRVGPAQTFSDSCALVWEPLQAVLNDDLAACSHTSYVPTSWLEYSASTPLLVHLPPANEGGNVCSSFLLLSPPKPTSPCFFYPNPLLLLSGKGQEHSLVPEHQEHNRCHIMTHFKSKPMASAPIHGSCTDKGNV